MRTFFIIDYRLNKLNIDNSLSKLLLRHTVFRVT